MSHYDSPIVRLTTGFIDNINDTVVGGGGGGTGAGGSAKTAGQLGQGFWLDDSILQWNSATAGFGGHFRYVRLSSASVAPLERGQIVFWDVTVADNLYQVTTSEAGTTPGAMLRAGIVLNASWTPGNYSVIQDVGPCYVQFRAALTAVPSGVGCGVYCAAAGAGVDNGEADVLANANPATWSDVSIFQGRYLGTAITLPVNGGLTLVDLDFKNIRG